MAEKDPVKAERLNEVYKHLFAHHGVESKTQLADILKVQRTGLAAAFGGSKANLTKNLFTKICAAFPGVFNLDYLLTGEGDLLTLEENVISERLEKTGSVTPAEPAVNIPDMSSVFNSALAAKDETIVSLKRELSTKDDIIQSLRDQLAAKDQLITEQKARLIDYRRIIDSRDGIGRYPFPIGAADGDKQKRTQK